MKKATDRSRRREITRREFVGGVVATGVLSGAPAILRGRNLNDSKTS